MSFLQHLLGTLPIVAALLAVRAANVTKAERIRQFLVPGVAAVYAAVVLVVFYVLNGWFDSVLQLVFGLIPVVRDWYTTEWLYVIENTVALVVFIGLKAILKPLFRRFSSDASYVGKVLAAGVYEYDKASGQWFIQRRLGSLRDYFRSFYWASIFATAVLIALVETFPGWIGFASISYPAIGALVIGEIYFAIDGITKLEHEADVFGEDDSAHRVATYSALRRVLRETFAGRVLADGVTFSSANATNSHARLNELTLSGDDIDRIAAGYFERVKSAGGNVDVNLIDASVALMHGSSVLINNPFYPDLTTYLGFPAYYHLLHNRKCLILCGRDSVAGDLVTWMRSGLEAITGVPDLWRVDLLTDSGDDELDVGVLRFADIHNLELIGVNDEFLSQVEFVILAEPSRMLTTGQLGLSLVLGRCAAQRSPVFAAFDRNHDGLVDTLSHLLKTDLTTVVASALPYGVSSELVWRANGPHMHSTILPNISRYLGVGTEIGAVALKYQVSHVEWVGSDTFPVQDMAWIAGQYYGQIAQFSELEVSQHAVAEAIIPLANPWGISRELNRFLIVEDEISNVYESVRLYASRAEHHGLVNVLSEDYLLRDYMIANRTIFQADAKAIPSIVPDFARTERNTVLRLVLLLRTFEVSDAELAKEFELVGKVLPERIEVPADTTRQEESPAVALLRQLIAKHTGVDEFPITTVMQPADVDAPHEAYRIASGSSLDEVIDALQPAYFFIEDELEDVNYIGAALYGHVYQLLIPGQFMTYAGKYYEVRSVGTAALRNGVVLRRAAEHISDRRTYRQLRRFVVSNVQPSDAVGAKITAGAAELTRSFATIEVLSIGYLAQASRSDLVNSHRVEVSGVPARSYLQKELLEIKLPGVPDRVRRTIAVLLNELFVTVFPHSHQFIVALTPDPDGECGDLLSGFECNCAEDSIFIVEDSLVDLGLIVAVERHRERLFDMIADYLLWLETPQTDATSGTASPQPEETVALETSDGLGPVDYTAETAHAGESAADAAAAASSEVAEPEVPEPQVPANLYGAPPTGDEERGSND